MKKYLISIVISIICFLVFVLTLYNVFIYIDPPITHDGHRYMPTSHIVKSVFFALIISILCFVFVIKKSK